MPPVSSDSSVLFATDHGSVTWTPEKKLRLEISDLDWTLAPEDLTALRDATHPLAAQVYRCNCDCRWQLRMEDHDTVVLGSDAVLRLDALLDGAVAMLELESILDDAAIDRPEGRGERREGREER